MKDSDLQQLLKAAAAPDRPADYWERFPKRVIEQIRLRQEQQRNTARSADNSVRSNPGISALRRFPAFGIGLAVLCVAVILVITLRHGQPSATNASELQLQEARKYFNEIEGLFPNQLQAIVLDKHGARLMLAKNPDIPKSPPLYLKICGPDGCQRFVTFSGQEIRVNGEACEVLVDHQGRVVLVGRDTVWSGSESTGKAGNFRIEARPLGTTT